MWCTVFAPALVDRWNWHQFCWFSCQWSLPSEDCDDRWQSTRVESWTRTFQISFYIKLMHTFFLGTTLWKKMHFPVSISNTLRLVIRQIFCCLCVYSPVLHCNNELQSPALTSESYELSFSECSTVRNGGNAGWTCREPEAAAPGAPRQLRSPAATDRRPWQGIDWRARWDG